jgi:hypothetical protein
MEANMRRRTFCYFVIHAVAKVLRGLVGRDDGCRCHGVFLSIGKFTVALGTDTSDVVRMWCKPRITTKKQLSSCKNCGARYWD